MASPKYPASKRPDELKLYHQNPRRGDISVIESSLVAHGQYKPVTVNLGTHTGRPHEVLAGNHTVQAIRNLAIRLPSDTRWHKVLTHYVDVDDDMARRIVVADNRTGQLGGFDDTQLAALLTDIGDLSGTGYSDDDLADLVALAQENATAVFDALTDEDGPGEGLLSGADMNAKADDYADKSTRMIILTLPIPQFIWAQETIEKYCQATGAETNSEAILTLLSEWSGNTPPAADTPLTAIPGTDTDVTD